MTVQLDAVIEQVEQLPSMPSTSVRIIQIATDPQASIDDILEVIQFDQSLTGQVLRLCNSAYFGLARKIGSLKEALAYLGAMPLLQLIMGVHCNAVLQQAQPGYGLMSGMLWAHSSAVALAAERLGRHAKVERAAVLFTAGLLHDIGKIVLGSFLSDAYQQVMDLLSTSPITFHEAEKQVLGYTHAEMGELIASKWQLPEEICLPARYHHEPGEYTAGDPAIQEIIEVIHLADSLALTMGVGGGSDGLRYAVDVNLAKKYQLTEMILDQISVQVLVEVQRLKELYHNVRPGQ